jgi:glycine betaine catabolism A
MTQSPTFVHTTRLPIASGNTLPGRYFTSPDIFAEEMERIFTRQWISVGPADRLRKPGEYFLAQLGPSEVMVLRDKTGAIRAYHNVCRHRGTRICENAKGKFGETIQCPYHAWTYALDGRLVATPSADQLKGFDKADYPLFAVPTHVWEGFIFVNFSADPIPFETTHAPLIGRFSRFHIPDLTIARRIDYDVAANWKLIVENYQECYHCAPIHPALTKLSPPTSGEMDLYEGPVLGGYMLLSEANDTMSMSGFSCGMTVSPDLPHDDLRRIYYYSIFPNVLLSMHHDYVMLHTLFPEAVDRTHITCEWLFHPESLDETRFNPDDGIAFWDMTNREDWHICEQSQRGVSSPAYRPGPYSARENLSAAFDKEVLRALGHSGEE